MNTTVIRLDGTTYDLAALGIATRDFNPSSPSYEHTTEKVEGRNGVVNTGTTHGPRPINCSFYLKAHDLEDYALARDEVFQIFRSDEPFYLIDSRNPGKRWKVQGNNTFNIDQQWIYGFFDIEFTAFYPFAESVGTTQDSFDTESGLWQVGQGLLLDEESQQYNFEIPSFKVYNAGNVVVDPREVPLKITITGAWDDVFLRNVTTNETFRYYAPLVTGDTLVLDGVKVLKNGVSVFKDTNYTPLTLAPGWNTFSLDHYTGTFSVSFDHRFYYR